jgi:hypothetical protein
MNDIRTLFSDILDKYHTARREVIWECYPRDEHKGRLAALTAEIEEYKRKMEELLKR